MEPIKILQLNCAVGNGKKITENQVKVRSGPTRVSRGHGDSGHWQKHSLIKTLG